MNTECITGFLRQKKIELSPQRHYTKISTSLLGIVFKSFPGNLRKMHNLARLKKKNRLGTYRSSSHKRMFSEPQKKYWLFIQIYRMPLVLYVPQHSQKEINSEKKLSFHLHPGNKSCFQNNTVGQAIIFTQTANVQY